MSRTILIYIISLLCTYSIDIQNASAQILKCTDKKTGKISYTDGNCETETEGKNVGITENIVPMGDGQSKNSTDNYKNLKPNEIQKSLQAALKECDQALNNIESIQKNPRASKKSIKKAFDDVVMLCPMDPGPTKSNCPESTVIKPNPVLFNTGEVMVLDTGEIIENVSYQYNYSYQYNPRIKFCRSIGKIYFQDKEISIQFR